MDTLADASTIGKQSTYAYLEAMETSAQHPA